MSKNSFAENFNDCVTGFPVVSVAAHIVLHEGLLKDIGKVGALAGLGYLGYNYGDKIGEWTGDFGNWLNNQGAHIGDWKIGNTVNDLGIKLTSAHNWAKEGIQDSVLGQAAGLGGEQAMGRRAYHDALSASQNNIDANYKKELANLSMAKDTGHKSLDDYNAEVQQLNNRRDQQLVQAQKNAVETMRDTMSKTVVDTRTGKTADPNAFNPQINAAVNGKITDTKYQELTPAEKESMASIADASRAHNPPANSADPALKPNPASTAFNSANRAVQDLNKHPQQTAGPLNPNTSGTPDYRIPQAKADAANQTQSAPVQSTALKPNTSGTKTYEIPQARAAKTVPNSGISSNSTPADTTTKPTAIHAPASTFVSQNKTGHQSNFLNR